MYTQHLNNTMKSSATVKNYLSGAKIYVELLPADASAFTHLLPKQVAKGGSNLSKHVPRQAPPLLPHHLVAVIPIMQSDKPDGFVCAAALSIAFFTFVRQSNVSVTPSVDWGGGPYTHAQGYYTHRRGTTCGRTLIKDTLYQRPPTVLAYTAHTGRAVLLPGETI